MQEGPFTQLIRGEGMAIGFDSKQIITFEELLMSQVIQQEALTRLLVEKGIFNKEEFLEKVREVDLERKKNSITSFQMVVEPSTN